VYAGPTVALKDFHLQYASLVDYWNQSYKGHLNAPFPHVVTRYEDLLFHTESVVGEICECAGGSMKEEFEFVVSPTKMGPGQAELNNAVGPPNGFVEAMIKYGDSDARLGFHEHF